MRCYIVSALAVALLSASAGSVMASEIENATQGSVKYQRDADVFGDAPDTCDGNGEALDERLLSVQENNTSVAAQHVLVPQDDVVDYFAVNITEDLVGERLRIEVRPADLNPSELDEFGLGLGLRAPACGEFIVAPAEGGGGRVVARTDPGFGLLLGADEEGGELQQVEADIPEAYKCNPHKWEFRIHQVAANPDPAPEAITLHWADGTTQSVTTVNPDAQVVKYRSTFKVDSMVTKATAIVNSDFRSDFYLSHGPCFEGDGGDPSDECGSGETWNGESCQAQPPAAGRTTSGTYFISFTPTEAGKYPIVLVLDQDDPGSVSMGRDCHEECVPQLMNDFAGSELTIFPEEQNE